MVQSHSTTPDKPPAAKAVSTPTELNTSNGRLPVDLGSKTTAVALLDLGADDNMPPRSIIRALERKETFRPAHNGKPANHIVSSQEPRHDS
jgi:hypothetical protein